MVKVWILGLTCALLALGCNWTDGQCWYRGEGGDFGTGVGVGGSFGVSVGAGVGGRGDHADPRSEEEPRVPPACNEGEGEGAERPKVDAPDIPDAPQAGKFAASLFKFKTTVADDGSDKGGGEQQADTVLTFMDWRGLVPKFWTCNITVRMALRTELRGTISAEKAADITAKVATRASADVMHTQPEWLPALFCSRFRDRMTEIFKTAPDYKGYGGRASAR